MKVVQVAKVRHYIASDDFGIFQVYCSTVVASDGTKYEISHGARPRPEVIKEGDLLVLAYIGHQTYKILENKDEP